MKFSEKIADLLYPDGLTCNICGKELTGDEREYSVCDDCAIKWDEAGSGKKYDKITVYSCFFYDGGVRKLVLDYKDSNKPHLTKYLAKYIYSLFRDYDLEVDCVAYVPSSPSAIRRRGYDGMKLVAEYFSAFSGIPVIYSLFRRDGLDQTKVSEYDRVTNVKDKFLCREGVKGKVLLLDDVVTSGATLNACAETLKSHGADEVLAFTFAIASFQ